MTRLLNWLLKTILFLLPWQTIYLVQERFLNGVKWQYGTSGFYATEILLWLTVIIFLFWFWQKRKQQGKIIFKLSKDRLLALSILVFIIYLLLSTTWALDSTLALQHTLHIMGAIILFFMLLLGPITWRELVKWFVAGALLTALLGFFQFFTQTALASKWLGLAAHPAWQAGSSVIVGEGIGRWLRAYGSFQHPNILGGYLFIAILGLSLLSSLKIENLRLKIPLLLTYGFLITVSFLTFSRSAFLALVLFLLAWLVYSLFKKNNLSGRSWAGLGIVLLVILTIIFWPVTYNRVTADSAHERAAVTERVAGVEESGQIFGDNKWLGVGPGNYTLAAYVLNPEQGGWEYQPVHNVGMLILAELGIIGVLLLFLVFITFFFSFSFKNYWQVFAICLLPYIFLLIFDHYLYSFYIGLLLSAVYGALITRFHTQELHS